MRKLIFAALPLVFASAASAQSTSQEAVADVSVPVTVHAQPVVNVTAQPAGRVLPAGSLLSVTPLQEISSKRVEVGEKYKFQVVTDTIENGMVVIPRGSLVTGAVSWKTGRAIGGKSGKFEITFETVSANGVEIPLTGIHRQEGRGNTVGALLGSILISGRSAVMLPGQLVNAMTKVPVAY